MYPIQSQDPIVSDVLAYQKELHRRTQRNSQGELCLVSRRKPSFLRQALSLVSSMINAKHQPKSHYQAA